MNKLLENFTLLYPNPEICEKDRMNVDFNNNPEMLELLGLNSTFRISRAEDKSAILRYVTCDVETINYRSDIFVDILKNKELYEILRQAHEYLTDIDDVMIRAKTMHKESELRDSLFVINEIEMYIKLVDYLAENGKKLERPSESKGLSDLFAYIAEIHESEEYKNLVKNVELLDFRINNMKSVTIGANLDNQLRITSAGVLSVNNRYFTSGSLTDMLLRMDFHKTEYTTIAPITANQKDAQAQTFNYVFLETLNNLYGSSIKKWRPIVNNFMNNNIKVLIKLVPEIKFILKCADIMFKLEEIGVGLCKPELFSREEKIFDIKGLYNASLAISLQSGDLILNDITFDENGMIYILTGPNRGGKSIITCAVGIAQLFCQLGMLIPAQSAKISPVDCIYTHFAGNYNTLEKGKLGEECERLNVILSKVTKYSLVLLDETLSSTGSFEGSYIAAEVVEGLSFIGCRCIYSTHMHELAALVDEINISSKNKVDTLVAGIEDGERSFKIKREKPDGKSYAKDIAQKYGISLKRIKEQAEL
ncbi:MAG: hypothetical protein FWD71_10805 [Oscillospiraceae bacterium]|nr:hypothetical protein [Oscillospiraceae bacterium]